MRQNLEIRFAKFHGLKNDFIVVAGLDLPSSASASFMAKLACAICCRHTGVGADGLALVLPPQSRKHDARVRFFNADGSEAEMSGNGIRCAAAFLVAGAHRKPPLKIETAAGVRFVASVQAGRNKWVFSVKMGAPILEPEKIPFDAGGLPAPIVGFQLGTQLGLLPVTVTSMGNPHCTVFLRDFDEMDWAGLGSEIERNPLFPGRTNVEFVTVISKREIEVRFWERGVGRTQSSGTGSCAAVVACILNNLTGPKVRVRTLAGVLDVAWPKNGEVHLTGPVERVAQGTYYFSS